MTWLTDDTWDWPDVTALVVDHLSDTLASDYPTAVVRTRVPDPRPDVLVRVRRSGGVRDGAYDNARMQVECSAADEATAADLVAVVREVLRRMPRTDPDVTAVAEIAGPALLSDPIDSFVMYLIAVEIRVKPTPASPAS